MSATQKKVVLNRPVFAQRGFDSRALTVLTTLLHRFPEPDDYEVFIQRGGQQLRRLHVQVAPENAEQQINLDMATLDGEACSCGCKAEAAYRLAAGGMMGFYVSQGTGKYTVMVTRFSKQEKAKPVLLDSSKVVPRGDFFAITLVQPGAYRVLNTRSKAEAVIKVGFPKRKQYRVDEATLVKIRRSGEFRRRSIQIYAGQTVVFQCNAPARLQIQMVEADKITEKPTKRPPYTLRKGPSKTDK